MEKKLTTQGPRTRKSYTVTLPIEWIKKERLDISKKVKLDIFGSKIIISPFEDDLFQFDIKVENYKNRFEEIIESIFIDGVDIVKIHFDDLSLIDKISQILEKKLIGFEIIEHKSNHIIIKEIAKESSEDFEKILRRIFRLIVELSLSRSIFQINSIDKNVKKLINYSKRILIKQGHQRYKKVSFYFLILTQLEQISSEMKLFLFKLNSFDNLNLLKSFNSVQFDSKIFKRDKDDINYIIFNNLINNFREAYNLFYKFSLDDFNKYQQIANQINIDLLNTDKIDILSLHNYSISKSLSQLYLNIFILKI